ncbi:MAG TPA: endonuclease/exonuclease/phosphatase family protein [Kineosporiaceae bacterium]|nr:endonuclease/exonuclease/phosphatase family protein [Kineosporiaceae bacterium]
MQTGPIMERRELRVVSWNVRDLLGDPFAVRRVITALAPDVLCLQEAPRRLPGVVRNRMLARSCGLLFVAGGRTSGGTAVLVSPRTAVRRAVAARLPVRGLFTRSRGLVVAELAAQLPEGPLELTVACLHLPLEPDLRVRHAELAVAALERRPRPHVVCGDLNEMPGSPAWKVLERLARDPDPDAAPTFPAWGPQSRVDAVFVGDGPDVVRYGEDGADSHDVLAATDHLPVVVDLVPSSNPSAGATG